MSANRNIEVRKEMMVLVVMRDIEYVVVKLQQPLLVFAAVKRQLSPSVVKTNDQPLGRMSELKCTRQLARR